MTKYLVTYEHEFNGFSNDSQDDIGNASFSETLRGAFDMKYIKPDRLSGIREMHEKDIAKRQYKSEGWFFCVLDANQLKDRFDVVVEGKQLLAAGDRNGC
jgi:hypothetical protein